MNRYRIAPLVLLLLTFAAGAAQAASLELNSIQFPEREEVDLSFAARPGAPNATISGSVEYREGQARIDLRFRSMKPAILFSGDVTCYVIWAVSMDGHVDNLGEFVVSERNHETEFSTAKKDFALMITAEPYYLVTRPSELVVFFNEPPRHKRIPHRSFTFSDFAPAPRHQMSSITEIQWDSETPLDLLQARKAFELAGRMRAESYAPLVYQDAGAALKEANRIAEKSRISRKLLDQARRSVALSNTAINISRSREQAAEMERQVARRRAEMEALEARATAAELKARDARAMVEAAHAENERLERDRDRIIRETQALAQDRATMESSLNAMRSERERLEQEKEHLNSRLEAALSTLATTRKSAKGYVVSLPDILFDVNEATLRDEAKHILAKLSGILLLMPDLKIRVEGHTDSTGGSEYNKRLSELRARSVTDFIAGQEISTDRLTAVGYGMERPVADNSTTEGRRQNRRVELVIGED